jgi:hypothetical protein
MTLARFLRFAVVAVAALVLALSALRMAGAWWRDTWMVDYARLPAHQSFERVFHRPSPAGISHIQAAGRDTLGGRMVWLRFEATPEAVGILTRGWESQSVARGELRSLLSLDGAASFFEGADRRPWAEVSSVRSPRCYGYSIPTGGGIRIVFDPQRKVAYVHDWHQ